MKKKKIIRITTVPMSLGGLLEGQLKFMSDYYEVVGIASSQGDRLASVGDKEGIRTIPVEMTRKITPLKDIKAVYKLYKVFKNEKPFIVHTHTPKAGTVGMIAAKLASVPNRLHTIAGLPLLEATGIKRKILNYVEKLTYKCATKIYPNSFGLKQIILDNEFTKPKKLKVIGNGSSNGIDTSHFNPELFSSIDKEKLRDSLKISPDDFVFIFVGRLVKDKGINELVSAFNQLNSKQKNIKLLLVGHSESNLDPLLPETETIINENSSIITTGWQEDVRPFFYLANVLVFPSYREGFPNVVLQAAAMKLPSIVTDINGCNEIITNNINGIIIPKKNVLSVYQAMSFFIGNKDKTVTMANNSREKIINNFSRGFVWKSILEEYNSLLNLKN